MADGEKTGALTATAVRDSDQETFRSGCHGEWLLYQGQFAEAAACVRATMEFEQTNGATMPDPGEMPAAELLAEAEEGLGNYDSAAAAWRRAAEQWEERLSSGHAWARQCRERARAIQERRAA